MTKEVLTAWRDFAIRTELPKYNMAQVFWVGDAMAEELEALDKRFVVLSQDLYNYILRNGKAKVRIKKLKAEIAKLKDTVKDLRRSHFG